MLRKPIAALGASMVLGTLTPSLQAGAADAVVVPRGEPIQIAVVLPFTGFNANLGKGAWNAVQLAVEKHLKIKGFVVQLNPFDGPCGDVGQNIVAANRVVDNPQNVAVIGHFCSAGYRAALPIYEAAGVVTLSGSATSPVLPAFGPSVFNDVAISDSCCPPQDNFDPWYNLVSQLPEDASWRQEYQQEFGAAPPPFADLYYDAASLLLDKIADAARRGHHHSLVIDRAALAHVVRVTADFDGVTCDIALGSDGYRVNDPVSLAECADNGHDSEAARD